GYSSAQAMKVLEEVFVQTMPPEMGYDYVGMWFQEKKAQEGVSPAAIFGLSLLFVFLIRAARYEGWSLPFSVLLRTPIAGIGVFLIPVTFYLVEQLVTRAKKTGPTPQISSANGAAPFNEP